MAELPPTTLRPRSQLRLCHARRHHRAARSGLLLLERVDAGEGWDLGVTTDTNFRNHAVKSAE